VGNEQSVAVVDARGLRCPMPLLRARRVLSAANPGEVIQIWATDLGAPVDFEAYCAQTGHVLVDVVREAGTPMYFKITLAKSS